jgi:pimeloyl-ACP methyl ester carboxylesterase
MPSLHLPRSHRSLLALGAAATLVGGAVAYKKVAAARARDQQDHTPPAGDASPGADAEDLGWGALAPPSSINLHTADGADLALWDIGEGPTVVLPHCFGCTHAIWVPVARRLVESGHRVVLYDQRGHGASTRGTAPLTIETLADDFAAVLTVRDVEDAVLAGHSMGGMTIMALAAHRPEVLAARARAIVLVATAAADLGSGALGAEWFAANLIASPAVSLALRSPAGHRFVRGVFGTDPARAHMDLTRTLFADTTPQVRAGFLSSMSTMNLLEGIASIGIPTTVIVGSRDRLTSPARAEQMLRAIPGARLVTLPGRGHMLPLEDADAVTGEIVRAGKVRTASELGEQVAQ